MWVLIESKSQMELSPKFKIKNKIKRKDLDALICPRTTLQATVDFS